MAFVWFTIQVVRQYFGAATSTVYAGRLPFIVEAGRYDARSETSAKSEVNIGWPSFRRL
jgi:hypothetical protein